MYFISYQLLNSSDSSDLTFEFCVFNNLAQLMSQNLLSLFGIWIKLKFNSVVMFSCDFVCLKFVCCFVCLFSLFFKYGQIETRSWSMRRPIIKTFL